MKHLNKYALLLSSLIFLTGCQTNNNPGSANPSTEKTSQTSKNTAASQNPSSSNNTEAPKEEEIAVTIHWNFDSQNDTVSNQNKGDYLKMPEIPTREGYLFSYFALDKEGKEAFDLSSTMESNAEIYAIWIADDANAVTVTFHSNDGKENDVYIKMSIQKDSRLKSFPSIKRDSHQFKGWYNSLSFEKTVSKATKYAEDTDIYARWFNIDVLEAEYTKLTDLTPEEDSHINDFGEKIGHGYSSDVSGTGLIFKANSNLVASNGYFICDLYYNEAFIQFDIESDKETSDATLNATLSCEYFDMTFTKDNWIVSVNDESIDYPKIVLDNVPTGRDTALKRPFSNHNITNNLHLKKGKNTIKLITNNSVRHDSTGTMEAEAPMIDCLTIYSDAKIDFDAHTDNIA